MSPPPAKTMTDPARFFSACRHLPQPLVTVAAITLSLSIANDASALAASPQLVDAKLDRIFIFSAVNAQGKLLIVRSDNDKSKDYVYGVVSRQTLPTLQALIKRSSNPLEAQQVKLIPTSLKYLLQAWRLLKGSDPDLNIAVIADKDEYRYALDLLRKQGLTDSQAVQELGFDPPVFCPKPAVYAEDKRITEHRRLTGNRFIPCSFSFPTLKDITSGYLQRNETSIVPIPLSGFIKELVNESDSAINALEVIAHPSIVETMQTNRR